MMTPARVCMLLKRYPRLSETFILNEIRALERLGVSLHIVSLLQGEDTTVQPDVRAVRAKVTYFPLKRIERATAVLRAHSQMLAANPRAYAAAAAESLRWSFTRAHPFIPWKTFWRAGYVAAQVRKDGVERIHAHFANGPAAVARLASMMTGVPFSFTTHAKDLYLSRPAVLREYIGHAEFTLTCTQANLQFLRALARPQDANKIHCIYHGIDAGVFTRNARPARSEDSAPLLLSVGRLVPKKGMDTLLRAIALLHKRGVALRCVIVGDGPLRRDLMGQAKRAGIEQFVHFAGAMPHDRLSALYAKADVFALAPVVLDDGDRDGIPNVLVEAMACGVPVVSTGISGVPELLLDGKTGLLVRPHDPQALADAIAASLQDRSAAAARCVRAERFVRERFDVWRNAEQIARLLKTGEPRVETGQTSTQELAEVRV